MGQRYRAAVGIRDGVETEGTGRCATSPVPCFESIAGSFEQVTLHGDALLCINIVLQLGVVIREVLRDRETERQRDREKEREKKMRRKKKIKRRTRRKKEGKGLKR